MKVITKKQSKNKKKPPKHPPKILDEVKEYAEFLYGTTELPAEEYRNIARELIQQGIKRLLRKHG